ncbi:hypothetical protein F5Y00DRAFT_271047 [Daldinia vernicosa]|uniref:uncharacterized protein n=1 Tax=Daldinia vernicosa TaxID=114800 RepID=UPI0020074F8F|nr:uncharacterized protein F5Y00DRAFT_271047 [Daldinia vernicosa]KAI0847496.1 hypothetical protein F5Y00DRAFT_271047 [Daldinia vernicosa]
MAPEQEPIRLDELPTIPSSMDPILTSSMVYQPLVSPVATAALPERTRLLNINGEHPSGPDEALNLHSDTARDIPASPIRANVKRRRSIVSAPGDILGRRLSRRSSPTALSHTDDLYRSRDDEVLRVPRKGTQPPKQTNSADHRSRKRGTSYPHGAESRKRQKVDGDDTPFSKPIIKRTGSAKSQGVTIPQLPLTGHMECNDNSEQVTYERKGAFRIRTNKGNNKFRFPKPRGQPEPPWRAGDGFSGDEARPSFLFFMTSTHKQRSPELLPGMGKLQLESEVTNKGHVRGSRLSGSKFQHSTPTQRVIKNRRGIAKDVWPTKENFVEELGPRHRRSTTLETQGAISSNMLTQPTFLTPQNQGIFSYKPSTLRKRKRSDFENFGRLKERSEPHFIDNVGYQSSEVHYIKQSKPRNEAYEHEEGYEADQEDITIPSTYNESEIDDDEVLEVDSYEGTPNESRSRESSARDSAIFVLGGVENETEPVSPELGNSRPG